nr:PREDICTED: uncharacterized protein LOC102353383 isoform X2 [Latimeria chalumnae]|eukprot:XP_005998043.1 PREDICTED: uncharacterized protein LOC102353383 isoform X2 [Latimeria chalumnae]
MPTCMVYGCGKTTGRAEAVTFHRFPAHEPIKSQWIEALYRGDLKNCFKPERKYVVCSDHFTPDCFEGEMRRRLMGFSRAYRKLKPHAVPTIFAFPQTMNSFELSKRRCQEGRVSLEMLEGFKSSSEMLKLVRINSKANMSGVEADADVMNGGEFHRPDLASIKLQPANGIRSACGDSRGEIYCLPGSRMESVWVTGTLQQDADVKEEPPECDWIQVIVGEPEEGSIQIANVSEEDHFHGREGICEGGSICRKGEIIVDGSPPTEEEICEGESVFFKQEISEKDTFQIKDEISDEESVHIEGEISHGQPIYIKEEISLEESVCVPGEKSREEPVYLKKETPREESVHGPEEISHEEHLCRTEEIPLEKSVCIKGIREKGSDHLTEETFHKGSTQSNEMSKERSVRGHEFRFRDVCITESENKMAAEGEVLETLTERAEEGLSPERDTAQGTVPPTGPLIPTWRTLETLVLLGIVRDSNYTGDLMAPSNRPLQPFWEKVSRNLESHGHTWSWQQCWAEWKTLKSSFFRDLQAREDHGAAEILDSPVHLAMQEIWERAGRPSSVSKAGPTKCGTQEISQTAWTARPGASGPIKMRKKTKSTTTDFLTSLKRLKHFTSRKDRFQEEMLEELRKLNANVLGVQAELAGIKSTLNSVHASVDRLNASVSAPLAQTQAGVQSVQAAVRDLTSALGSGRAVLNTASETLRHQGRESVRLLNSGRAGTGGGIIYQRVSLLRKRSPPHHPVPYLLQPPTPAFLTSVLPAAELVHPPPSSSNGEPSSKLPPPPKRMKI